MNATTSEAIVMAMDSPNIRKITVERPFLHHRSRETTCPDAGLTRSNKPDAAPANVRRGIVATWIRR
ncbi:Uncharacterised protein [Mycobacteroides abscessus subsp. abscessus]|nr:Uncharacterised protein [Mycobacteroides abscessus subsp. abscessus]